MVSETEDILRRTLEGLEGDFEELRQELLTDLENHDDELRFYVDSLPDWLALPVATIRNLLKFSPESNLPGAALGPHAVALVAGELEAFTADWLGSGGEITAHPFEIDPTLPAQFHEAHDTFKTYIETIEAEASATALAAHASLNHIRDDILAELEEEREQDTEALQELISMGDIDRNQDHRQEIARLWEDQRERANAFLERWEKLDSFIDIGLERTKSGLEELGFLLANMHQGMLGGHPVLAQTEKRAATRERKPSMSLVLDEEELDELRGEDRSGVSQELSVLPTEPPSVSAAPERDGDFDPYGDLPEEEKEDVDPAKLKAEQRAKFLAETRERKREKEAFLRDPEQLDDDLVFASTEEQGPMVDFFDEDDPPSGDFFGTPTPTPQKKTPSPEANTAKPKAARSPYDVFLSEESSPQSKPIAVPSAHEPLAMSSIAAAPEQEDDPFDFDPEASEPTFAPEEEIELPTTPPEVDTTEAPALEEDAQAEIEEPTSSTAPLVDDLEDQPTIPFGGLEATETEPPSAGDEQPARAEESEESAAEDAGPTQPSIEAADASSTSPGAEPTSSTDEVEVDATGAAVEELPPPPPVSPATPEEVPESAGEDVERDESALEEPLVKAPEPVAPPTAPASEPAEEPTTKPPRERPSVRGEAIRVRRAHRPVAMPELALAYGLPLAILLVILGLAATAKDAASNPLAPGSVTQVLALVLFAWLVLGPWVMRWKIAFHGWRPIVMRRAQLRDEAEVILEGDHLELGPWTMQVDALKEVSFARWESPLDKTRGWLLTLIDGEGEIWAIVTPESDKGSDWEASSLPITHAPSDAWQVDPGLFGALEGALLTSH